MNPTKQNHHLSRWKQSYMHIHRWKLPKLQSSSEQAHKLSHEHLRSTSKASSLLQNLWTQKTTNQLKMSNFFITQVHPTCLRHQWFQSYN
jgi:hypothetical protein